jgi:hypothetical protein
MSTAFEWTNMLIAVQHKHPDAIWLRKTRHVARVSKFDIVGINGTRCWVPVDSLGKNHNNAEVMWAEGEIRKLLSD